MEGEKSKERRQASRRDRSHPWAQRAPSSSETRVGADHEPTRGRRPGGLKGKDGARPAARVSKGNSAATLPATSRCDGRRYGTSRPRSVVNQRWKLDVTGPLPALRVVLEIVSVAGSAGEFFFFCEPAIRVSGRVPLRCAPVRWPRRLARGGSGGPVGVHARAPVHVEPVSGGGSGGIGGAGRGTRPRGQGGKEGAAAAGAEVPAEGDEAGRVVGAYRALGRRHASAFGSVPGGWAVASVAALQLSSAPPCTVCRPRPRRARWRARRPP